MGKVRSRATLFAALMVVAATLAGCGGSSSTGISAPASTTSQAAIAAKAVPVALHLTQGSYSLSAPGTTISGTASKGASISVNGSGATVHSGRWHERLDLHIGSNRVEVEATMSGRSPTSRVIHVVRHHSAAELEALAQARALRAQVKLQHETAAPSLREPAHGAKTAPTASANREAGPARTTAAWQSGSADSRGDGWLESPPVPV
jgi:hypothetical protein